MHGKSVDFAVEYERTLKSPAKYEKIREAIESEKRLKAFLYLVPNYELLHGIEDAFWRMKQLVLFGLVDEFKRDRLDTRASAIHITESRHCRRHWRNFCRQGPEYSSSSLTADDYTAAGLCARIRALPFKRARRSSNALTFRCLADGSLIGFGPDCKYLASLSLIRDYIPASPAVFDLYSTCCPVAPRFLNYGPRI